MLPYPPELLPHTVQESLLSYNKQRAKASWMLANVTCWKKNKMDEWAKFILNPT